MEKSTLNMKLVCFVMATVFLLTVTSCTKDSSDSTLYEQEAKMKRNNPIEKPVVDRTKIRVKPDRGGG